MRPDMSKDIHTGWIVLAVVAVITVIAYMVVSDGGTSAKRYQQLLTAYQSSQGDTQYPLQEEIRKQRLATDRLINNLELIKKETGITPIQPFSLPANYLGQKGSYFRKLYDISVEYLRGRARNKRISYEDNLGFTFPDALILEEDVAEVELKRLQLSVRAILLALSTPDRLREVSIEHGTIIKTGPISRPPLLREYPFTVSVRGSLKDILWLLHQYSADTVPPDSVSDWNKFVNYSQRHMKMEVKPTRAQDHFPLILRGFSITSNNTEPIDNISQLDAVFELGGMEFLSDAERQAAHEPQQQQGNRRGRRRY